ncbi:phosphonate metabolism protein/1,5-bisphosphokinase (PRPP-forming) PhnN [Bordetella genomosp. 11]|uniref:Ribose 1,5-bisphosphate phosphokinase PhnN n=1 Tax=Bordetella genomosp. 11 TaxID=1416808 RepID=A0A261UZM3_9BORD|nr:phosphonate metabolism protein/1,5-bisphosphokinase (PRPP-forming) PhnN [Bordetella genomosp. 11]OZI67115.1 phosphonate metabolism protein/1,5-bisphosphokinase (PRPP-forming) PhnN [Bordetella genomosp. 11]
MNAPAPSLVYIMGASGSGKDTLLRHVRGMSTPRDRILVAHRYITRPSGVDEASVALSEDEFVRREQLGCFALSWRSHGLAYGVGVEIDAWMAAGVTVLVNGSRAHLPRAWARYPGLCAVEIAVDARTLKQRLSSRGRENTQAIEERLARATAAFDVPAGCELLTVDNNGAPEQAADRVLEIARRRHA